MKFEIEIDENEIIEKAKQLIVEDIASRMLAQFRRTPEKYCYHTVIKECVREVIKRDIDNLSDRAVEAASVSIANKGLKKISAEELLSRLSREDQSEVENETRI